ncbi:hypothetical protein NYC76_000714 [Campylobacter upsaliensis]|nr:hypothetical protein [Campylobacter upsaliensis]
MRNSRLATRLSHLAYNIKGITRMMSPRFYSQGVRIFCVLCRSEVMWI